MDQDLPRAVALVPRLTRDKLRKAEKTKKIPARAGAGHYWEWKREEVVPKVKEWLDQMARESVPVPHGRGNQIMPVGARHIRDPPFNIFDDNFDWTNATLIRGLEGRLIDMNGVTIVGHRGTHVLSGIFGKYPRWTLQSSRYRAPKCSK